MDKVGGTSLLHDPELCRCSFDLAIVQTPKDVSFATSPLDGSLSNVSHYITRSLSSNSGHVYPALCYEASTDASATSECFTALNAGTRTSTLTLSFIPGKRDEFASSLKRTSFPSDASGTRYNLESPQTAGDLLEHGRWIAYAAKALITRFYDLASKADSLDILLVLAGYILMHTTFFRLLLSARALGSNFWLTAGILTSATSAFVLAMPAALHLGIPVDPVLLTEALPFLVCTVGFEKPLRLARAVFTHEHIYTPIDESGNRSRSRGTLKPAGQVILEAYDRVGNSILRDYALEIFVLTVGASSKVGGLRECCALAAVILALDCIALTSMYTAVLSVMVEVSTLMPQRLTLKSLPLLFPFFFLSFLLFTFVISIH